MFAPVLCKKFYFYSLKLKHNPKFSTLLKNKHLFCKVKKFYHLFLTADIIYIFLPVDLGIDFKNRIKYDA